MRRLLQIAADGNPGGGTTVILGICDDLASRGNWEVSLLINKDSYALIEASKRGLSAYGCNFFSSRFDLTIPWRIRKLIDQIRPDLIHVHGGRAAHQFNLAPLKGLKCALVYTVHGYHFANRPPPFRLLGRIAEKMIAKRVNHVCFVSKADESIGIQHGIVKTGCQSSVIYNGIDPNDLPVNDDSVRTHDIVFIGRLVRQKNPHFAIDVIDKLKEHGVTLLMVGGGELESSVRARAQALGVSHLVTFTGQLARAAAVASLRRARVYLFPSRWEGLPVGPMEAMYCGVPVVGSRIGGTDEVVSNGEDGVLIERFDASLYARSIMDLLKNDGLRQKYVENGKKKVAGRFLRNISSDSYLDLYDRVYRERQGSYA
jgi:glycosyltransferase involved in cell wall biosynthesis